MKKNQSKKNSKTKLNSYDGVIDQASHSEESVEVLYQKMGDRWFAFSLIEDEVYMGSVTQDEIDASSQKPPRKAS